MVKREDLPYRSCVGIALLNERNRVWLGQRVPRKWDSGSHYLWQMPQGGIDDGEALMDAAFRELHEETGIKNARVITEIDDWLTYELPDELLGTALKGRYRGQKQKWFVMRFHGHENEINLSPPGHEAEFQSWRWAYIEELSELIIPFKRQVYETIAIELQKTPLPVDRDKKSDLSEFLLSTSKKLQSFFSVLKAK